MELPLPSLSSLPIPQDPLAQGIVVFFVFIVFVALAYKLFKLAFSAAAAAAVGFSFPWINAWLNTGLPVATDLQTSIFFAGAALGLFLAYQFFHYIVAFAKVVTWPFRAHRHSEERKKVKELEKEVKELEERK
jgi:hypothetical protein